ncbi:hypothetical protein ONS95_009560 [Cadophora gregata]|uniref:uncharacterized protein n=1 Tax=Cadophora gregata TaxID=51156 RepID=UPI0026DCF2DD|nr:uncharacterized protein ONS95_009560 [Cadophora gregata]KAK0124611.1 hypothetical protein ONS95_009560 [Cadophora gregata]KAK0129532.1 hypothetical protein ONS96_000097 [Cadophora gregata f. sp. sojae]
MSATASASTCVETSYSSPKGLQFSLYCDQDRTSVGDIDNAGADNVEDCLNQCSMHSGKACGAAAFDSTARKCYFKNSTITEVGAVRREGWTLGIANRTLYQPLSMECTNNGANQKVQNGLNFTVYCDQTVVGFDTCPDNSPDCRAHTESLDECLEICSTLHPLCTGVAWDPSLTFGYLNCYPKNATSRVFDNARVSSGDGLRCAKALLEVPVDDCPTAMNGTVIASNKDPFKLSCGEDRPGNNITAQHAGSLGDCVDACATDTQANCLGAVFDTNMVNGYENCYLKSAVGFTTVQSGFTFALRQTTSNNTSSDNLTPPSPDKSSNKAWIAGLVVGVVVAIALIIAAIWWFRKRKVSKKEVESTEIASTQNRWLGHEESNANALKYGPAITELDDASAAPKYEMGSGGHNADAPKYELDAESRPMEMDCTKMNGYVDGRDVDRR